MRLILAAFIPFLTLALPTLAAAQSNSAASNSAPANSAMSYDAARNVFTMAPTIEKVTPGVVSISTVETHVADGSTIGGIGSGVIIDGSDGLILTNNHVIEDAKTIDVILSDKRRYRATILGQDPETDLALLQIPGTNLTALPVSATDDDKVGDLVIAVGNPFGLTHSVSTGIISAIGRAADDPLGYSDLIQTDAAINPGNSGGALVNSAGELIGINSALISKEQGGGGIGFAIPAHTFRAISAQLRVYGEVKRGSLGVLITPVTQDVQARLTLPHLDGAHIVDVTEDGAGFAAGLKIDDIVTRFAGREIGNSSDLRYAVGLVRPNTEATLTYFRDGVSSEMNIIVREKGFLRTANVEATQNVAPEN